MPGRPDQLSDKRAYRTHVDLLPVPLASKIKSTEFSSEGCAPFPRWISHHSACNSGDGGATYGRAGDSSACGRRHATEQTLLVHAGQKIFPRL